MTVSRSRALRFLLVAGLACTSTLEPRPDITLLVTNGTCSPAGDQCQPLRVLAFPHNQPQPPVPSGFWKFDLGVVTGPTACLTLPLSKEFVVTGPSSSQTWGWNTAQGVSLGAVLESESTFPAVPSTEEFVPAGERGWAVTLPGAGRLSPTPGC
jgi:hypothetical protein